jgi:hypothetical protein
MAEILERLGSGLIKILGWFKNPELIKPIDEGVEVEEPSKKLDETKDFPETFGELLDNLEHTFDAYKVSTYSGGGWLTQDEIVGLKKLGAHVPNPWQARWLNDIDELKVNPKNLPAMMFINIPSKHDDKSKHTYPDFIFGIKNKKLPWNVEKLAGVPYKMGMAYRMEKKLFWMCVWVVVQKDGSYEFCKERTTKTIYVTKGKNKGYGYDKKAFVKGALIEEDGESEEAERKRELNARNAFKWMVDWWQGRNDRWSVAVKKSGDRVTFAVDRSLTKKYFADRDKTIKTPTGRNKKIVHYVKEHERDYNGKKTLVREHIRGVNKFSWKGYDCLVTAPEFHSLPTAQFNVGAEDVERLTESYIAASKVGHILASAEERRSIRGEAR